MSTVKISEVYPEAIVEWFFSVIMGSCGDGAAVICCNNPRETADFFIKWWTEVYLPEAQQNGYKRTEFYHPREEYTGPDGEIVVNYHDSNENFMFCDKEIDLGHGDVSFIIEEDCKSYKGFIIEGLK